MNHMIDADYGTSPNSPKWAGHNEPEQTCRCCICDKDNLESESVKDFIDENYLCNRKECIEQIAEIDLEHCYSYEFQQIETYYENLINQIK